MQYRAGQGSTWQDRIGQRAGRHLQSWEGRAEKHGPLVMGRHSKGCKSRAGHGRAGQGWAGESKSFIKEDGRESTSFARQATTSQGR